MKRAVGVVLATSMFAGVSAADRQAGPIEHVNVYKEAGRFGGWPANHGIWSWDNEILVGFEAGHFQQREQGHAIDYSRPAEHLLARSRDGGETWTIETPPGLKPPPGQRVAGVPTGDEGRQPVESPGGIDFTHPDFVLTARMTSIHTGPSHFYYSLDRGRSWHGPFALPDFGQPGIAARTDYLVEGKHELTMFLTAAKSNGREGRVICVRTTDGGKTWTLVAYVQPEPEGNDYGIMPSSVRLSPTSIVTAVRHRRWIDLHRTDDNGATWGFVTRAVPDTGRGNPPSLLKLRDGRLALVYGYRAEPYGIRARLSDDEGQTWSEEIILRKDGGNWDLGYPRTVQRPDGKLVTVYYFNDAADRERYIAATIWDAGSGEAKTASLR
jgi:hypothetical protein